MIIIDGQAGLPRVKFGSVSLGETFYCRDVLFVKARARVEGGLLKNCGGAMTDFGLSLHDGYVMTFEPDQQVVPAKAHVVVEAVGRFS